MGRGGFKPIGLAGEDAKRSLLAAAIPGSSTHPDHTMRLGNQTTVLLFDATLRVQAADLAVLAVLPWFFCPGLAPMGCSGFTLWVGFGRGIGERDRRRFPDPEGPGLAYEAP